MAHIFISYAHVDGDFAKELIEVVKNAGFKHWIDSEKLREGEDWRQELDKAIRASFALVVIMTPKAKASEYVTYEWAFALGVGVKVIPILPKPFKSSIWDRILRRSQKLHPRLEILQHFDFFEEPKWGKLIQRLKEIEQEHISQEPFQRAKAALNDSHPENRKDGISTLVEMNAIEALAEAVSHPTRSVRIDAAFGLCDVTNFTDIRAINGLLDGLKDTDWTIRASAARALGKIGNFAPVSALAIALNDMFGEVRLAASQALGDISDPNSVLDLIKTLRNSTYPLVQHVAAESLARIGRPAIPELIKIINDKDVGAIVCIHAVNVLGVIGDSIAVNDLLKLLVDKNSDVIKTAIKALGKTGDPRTIPKLVEIMYDPNNDDLCGDAAFALGKMGKSALPSLLDAVQDARSYLRKLAIETLAEIGEVDTIPTIINALCDSNYEVRNAAMSGLIRIGDQCTEQILAVIQNVTACGREEAIVVFGKIGKEVHANILLEILRKEGKGNPKLCLQIVRALGEFRNPIAVQDLILELSNNYTIVFYVGYGIEIPQRICDVAEEALEKINSAEAVIAVKNWRREQGS
ncbi:MAG: HEAT repeat domain-containing protein [Anaerolineae bacterium]|nr:HEAT repeat domain-containing protein [Anaerolineae bacterium]